MFRSANYSYWHLDTFPKLIAGGVTTADWQYVRMTANHFDRFPVMDVNSIDIRCNLDPSLPTTQTMPLAAGSQVGFTASPPIFHSGPLQFYMAKVPSGETAASWDGSGEVWFKIHALGPTVTPLSITFPALCKFTTPHLQNSQDDLILTLKQLWREYTSQFRSPSPLATIFSALNTSVWTLPCSLEQNFSYHVLK